MKTPNGMSARGKGGMGYSFNKLDRFEERESGKDTLHNTVGMSY